jgi:molybdopterin-guanine dinucleotide biosynthesis protein A
MRSSHERGDRLGAVILAGGRATRLSDKCFRLLRGKELVLHVFERVSVATPEVVVVGKTVQDVSRLQQVLPKARIIHDELPAQSPLVGLICGLHALGTEYVFAAGCDMPFLEPQVIRSLHAHAIGRDAAIPYSEGKLEPLCAVYNRISAIRAASNCLQSKRTSILEMIGELKDSTRVSKEDFRKDDPHLLTFINVNTEDELMTAEDSPMRETRFGNN